MAVLQGGRQNLPSPFVCYPKDPMWNRVKSKIEPIADNLAYSQCRKTHPLSACG